MALSDERRAIADGMAVSRAPTSAASRAAVRTDITASRQGDGGAARRASGAANAASRRGESVVEDVNRIVTPPRKTRTLRTVDPAGVVPAKTSPGTPRKYKPAQSGAGVAWPLTEEDFNEREYWPDALMSSDGLFFFPALKTIVLTDAEGNGGAVNLAEPPSPSP